MFGKPLGLYPFRAPMDPGSECLDWHTGETFVAASRWSADFDDSYVVDTRGRNHNTRHVVVIRWCSPDEFAQRQQDTILARLEAAYS